jgi:integrase
MPKQATPLTAAKVKTAAPGRYFDGDGLVLLVRKARPKQVANGTAPDKQPDRAFWLFRFTRGGKVRETGLGRARGPNAVSLAEARERARKLRDKLRDGTDPIDEKQAEKAKAKADAAKAQASTMTFREVSAMYLGAHEASWTNSKHRQQWKNTLRDYVLPAIGDLPVGSVDTGAVVKIIEPLWRGKTETASRVRGRIENILDYAKVRSWRDGENPARWRGHLDHLLPRRGKVQHVEHHAALPWRESGAFMQRLRQNSCVSARCLEFLILTANRSGEVRGARWNEIDLTHAVWTIPAERMKAEREHRVPLSDAALAVLREMAELGGEPGAFVFPVLKKPGRPLSDTALAKAVDAAGSDATVHGFRSTFRDWAGETTTFPREVIEMALAHRLGDAAEQAYARGDLFQKRAALMRAWADFCGRAMPAGEVVQLRAIG